MEVSLEYIRSEDRVYQFFCPSCAVYGHILASSKSKLALICTSCYDSEGKQINLKLEVLELFKLGNYELQKIKGITLNASPNTV